MMHRVFKPIFVLIVMLTIQSNHQIQAQIEVVDEIRDAITNPICEASCFLGIEPGITSVDDVETILGANNLTYERTDSLESDYYTYYVDMTNNGIGITFVDAFTIEFVPDYLSSTGNDVAEGIGLQMFSQSLSVEDALTLFTDPPDKIAYGFGEFLLYSDERVLMATNSSYRVYLIQLLSLQTTLFRLQEYDDLQPCTEPAIICSIPTAAFPALESFTQLPIDQSLSDGVTINLEPNLNIRANTTPETVGSVVFSDGTNTIVDNSAPYEFPITSAGSYMLTATPYSEADGGGTAGTPLTVTFTVVEGGLNR